MSSRLFKLASFNSFFSQVSIAFAFAAFFSYQAAAFELSAKERTSLSNTVDGFDASMRKLDMRGVFKILPPKILEHMRVKANVSEEQLLDAVDKQFKDLLSKVEIVDFKMSIDSMTLHKLENGFLYALIPTETSVRMSDKIFVSESQTLAILERGNWYLMRTNEPHILAVLVDVYPAFSGVTFPEEKSKVVVQ